MACFCFGTKAQNTTAADAGERPLPPLEPTTYVLAGPRHSGRRTVAKHLLYAAGFRPDTLAAPQLRRVRLGVQLSAARALLLGARGGRVPPEATQPLEAAVAQPLDELVASPERERHFLETAAAFARLDSVHRACARPGNPALRNTATSLFAFPHLFSFVFFLLVFHSSLCLQLLEGARHVQRVVRADQDGCAVR